MNFSLITFLDILLWHLNWDRLYIYWNKLHIKIIQVITFYMFQRPWPSMSTSKDASRISKGVLIVMFLIIVLLICFTDVRVYGHPMFITWDDAQVFIYDKPKFSLNTNSHFRWYMNSDDKGLPNVFFMGTENSKTLGCRGSRGR